MVEATDFANRDDPAEFRLLNWPAVGCILVEREVSKRPVVVREVAREGAAEVPFAEDEDVIQTLTPNRADEALREGVVPWAVRLSFAKALSQWVDDGRCSRARRGERQQTADNVQGGEPLGAHPDPLQKEEELEVGRRSSRTEGRARRANRLSWIRLPVGRSDGAGHRLRESRRPYRVRSAQLAGRLVHPCRARGEFVPGDSTRSSGSGS